MIISNYSIDSCLFTVHVLKWSSFRQRCYSSFCHRGIQWSWTYWWCKWLKSARFTRVTWVEQFLWKGICSSWFSARDVLRCTWNAYETFESKYLWFIRLIKISNSLQNLSEMIIKIGDISSFFCCWKNSEKNTALKKKDHEILLDSICCTTLIYNTKW